MAMSWEYDQINIMIYKRINMEIVIGSSISVLNQYMKNVKMTIINKYIDIINSSYIVSPF
jgi:hypothetical protein